MCQLLFRAGERNHRETPAMARVLCVQVQRAIMMGSHRVQCAIMMGSHQMLGSPGGLKPWPVAILGLSAHRGGVKDKWKRASWCGLVCRNFFFIFLLPSGIPGDSMVRGGVGQSTAMIGMRLINRSAVFPLLLATGSEITALHGRIESVSQTRLAIRWRLREFRWVP